MYKIKNRGDRIMKKLFSKIASVSLAVVMSASVLTVAPITASAATFTSSDYEYSITSDNNARITAYSGKATTLTVPSTLDGHTVTSIGIDAFNGNKTITSITIPKTVTDGGLDAFANTNIKTAVIENGATVVADSLFSNCDSLVNVTIPDSVTSIESHAFADCSSLKNVTLPKNLKSIAIDAFDGCTGLTEITIPKTVDSISVHAIGYNGKNKIDNFVIKGYAGTEAQKYAEENGFTFIALEEPKPVGIIGDVNQDGILDVADATYLQMHLAGYKNSDGTAFIDTYNSNMFMIADVNGDAVLDVADVTQIQMKLAGLVK